MKEVINIINWNDYSPLTKDEWLEFVEKSIYFLKKRENKNDWDFFINNFSFSMFCDMSFCESYDIIRPKIWQDNCTKAKDLKAIWDLIIESDWTKEENKYKKDNDRSLMIYDLISKKIYNITEEIFK